MCGRFAFFRWSQTFAATAGFPNGQMPSWNIAPGANVLIQRQEAETLTLARARWGLTPAWLNDLSKTPAHARAETLQEQPMFREAFAQRRCLVPANGFYEWRGTLRKRPFWLTSEAPIMYLAGIWEAYPAGEVTYLSVALVTQAAAHLRRPLILDEHEQALWLNSATPMSVLQPLLRNPHKPLRERALATLVNDPTLDAPECLTPA